MLISASVAFLHHLAAFIIVAVLFIELSNLDSNITVRQAKNILTADRLYAAAAVALIVLGILRVVYFEKGASYYLNSAPFIAKILLYVAVGLLSIYPTRAFLQWRKALSSDQTNTLEIPQLKRIRLFIYLELLGIVLILFCAALMAKGVGFISD